MKNLQIVSDIVIRIPIIHSRLCSYTIQACKLDPYGSLIAMTWTFAVLVHNIQHAGLSLHFLKLFAYVVLETRKSYIFAFLDNTTFNLMTFKTVQHSILYFSSIGHKEVTNCSWITTRLQYTQIVHTCFSMNWWLVW